MYAQIAVALGFTGIDRAVELGEKQVAENVVADRARPGGGPHHGNRLGVKDGVEFRTGGGMLGHTVLAGKKVGGK